MGNVYVRIGVYFTFLWAGFAFGSTPVQAQGRVIGDPAGERSGPTESSPALSADRTETDDSSAVVEGNPPAGTQWLWLQVVPVAASGRVEKTADWFLHLSGAPHFSQRIWLKNGPGEYLVTAYASKSENRVATYNSAGRARITNHDPEDHSYTYPSGVVESDDPDIRSLGQNIAARVPDPLARSHAVHDWVATNIAYDLLCLRGPIRALPDAATTLRNRKAICGGYASLNAALQRAAGLPARVVNGASISVAAGDSWTPTNRTKINHAWNEVFVQDRWIIEDVTWDAGAIDLHSGEWHFRLSDKYFDPAPEFFALSHLRLEESGD